MVSDVVIGILGNFGGIQSLKAMKFYMLSLSHTFMRGVLNVPLKFV